MDRDDANPLMPELARVEERVTETADTISLRLSYNGSVTVHGQKRYF